MDVSIIIPVYNVERYIWECLESVANQKSSGKIECIVVDDCGNDNSMLLAEKYVQQYKGDIIFRIVHHAINRGLSAARNTGIKEASLEYVFFLDSDDFLYPECIKILDSIIKEHPDLDMIQCAFCSENLPKNMPYEYDVPVFSDNPSFIKSHYLGCLQGNIIMAQNRLLKRSLIIENNLFFREGIIHEDNYWTFLLVKYIKSIAFCKQRVYYYRNTPGSITNNIVIEKEGNAYQCIIKELSENIDNFLPGLQKEYILTHLICAINAGYFNDNEIKRKVIDSFLVSNTMIERYLCQFILNLSEGWVKNKVLHLLIRLYKIHD